MTKQKIIKHVVTIERNKRFCRWECSCGDKGTWTRNYATASAGRKQHRGDQDA